MAKKGTEFSNYRHPEWTEYKEKRLYPFLEGKALNREDIDEFIESIASAALSAVIAEIKKSGVYNKWRIDKDGSGCLITELPGIPFEFTVGYDAKSLEAKLQEGYEVLLQVQAWEYDKAQREMLRDVNLQNLFSQN